MTPAAVEEAAARFGLGPPVEPPVAVARGAMGRIWHVRTGGGRWAVKTLFGWVDASPRPDDVDFQVAAAAGGVLLPLPILTADGAAVVDVAGGRARAYEWVDLADPLEPPVDAATAAEVGRLLATVHRLPLAPAGPVESWYQRPPEPARWAALVKRAEATGAAWSPGLAGLGPSWRAAIVGGPRFLAPVLCHRDFDPSNVVPTASGDLVVLDWENAGPLSADADLACAFVAWCADPDGAVDPDAVAALADGYRGAGGPATALRPGSFDTAVVTAANYVVVLLEGVLDDPEERAHAEPQLRAAVERRFAGLLRAVEELRRRLVC